MKSKVIFPKTLIKINKPLVREKKNKTQSTKIRSESGDITTNSTET